MDIMKTLLALLVFNNIITNIIKTSALQNTNDGNSCGKYYVLCIFFFPPCTRTLIL